jgi:DNA invertase Pin-like site-specific DNA recombinase
LAKTLEMLREGDTLVVWKLDRLGRSVKQLVDLVGDLHKHGVQFRSLTDSIDTGTPSGRFFFHVMASLAEMERELTVERTRAGLEVAKQLGRKGGRKPKMTDSKIESAKKLLASGVPPKDVAKNLGVSIPTLYRWVPASRTLSVLYLMRWSLPPSQYYAEDRLSFGEPSWKTLRLLVSIWVRTLSIFIVRIIVGRPFTVKNSPDQS